MAASATKTGRIIMQHYPFQRFESKLFALDLTREFVIARKILYCHFILPLVRSFLFEVRYELRDTARERRMPKLIYRGSIPLIARAFEIDKPLLVILVILLHQVEKLACLFLVDEGGNKRSIGQHPPRQMFS
jgi:hypothetical protein